MRPLFLLVCVLFLLGAVAPFIRANWLSDRIKQELESSLGRKVEFQSVHFTLFAGPGFSLENVTIGEDPRFGLEPFAFVPALDAHLRLDKLLSGQIRFTSFRLIGPSLNLVKASDGSWNVVQLLGRLSAPRRPVLNLFPTFEVSEGRVDIKLGARKTVLYISQSDLSVYPQRSGKVYIRFSGSPARTDRAGMGFGHFRGYVNWFAAGPRANQLESRIRLDPSNLSELTTLFAGHDAGVHGNVSSVLAIVGPASALRVEGELTLNDVHRWDLLPSRGETWTVGYGGNIDLLTHRIDLRTIAPSASQPLPVGIHLRVDQFLSNPACSVMAEMRQAPLARLIPLAARMGLSLPSAGEFSGAVTGAIGYSNTSGWSGAFTVNDAQAAVPGGPHLQAAEASVTVDGDRIQLHPAAVETESGSLRLSGDYIFASGANDISLTAARIPLAALKSTTSAWFEEDLPVGMLSDGRVTGQLTRRSGGTGAGVLNAEADPTWSGQFDFTNATLSLPALATPLREASGHVVFNNSALELDHLAARLHDASLRASYQFNPRAKRPEKISISVDAMDSSELGQLLSPAFEPGGIFARLRLTRRMVPAWLAALDAEGELTLQKFSLDGRQLGPLRAHFVWQGTDVRLTDIGISLPGGQMIGHGELDLASYSPQWHMEGNVNGFEWKGGSLDVQGELQTTGLGEDSIRNLKAKGSFVAQDIALSSSETFDRLSGTFAVSMGDGWPDLRVGNIDALKDQDQWTGDAFTQSDGKLLFDLEHAGRQMRIVSTLSGENISDSLPVGAARTASR